ncbi:hypothetical protein [Streptacidiphilus rugosus]|uniref:hypothetical protein n=1 Tax=Streptacidiphilus rugosus TaxID=405783 RepID=UPI000B2F3112|nr:hypothetical protein [Streptacidiphilus rugosus]
MDQNEQLLLKQVADARAALAEAVAAQDPVGLSRALDELEEALRQAREGGADAPSDAAVAGTESGTESTTTSSSSGSTSGSPVSAGE